MRKKYKASLILSLVGASIAFLLALISLISFAVYENFVLFLISAVIGAFLIASINTASYIIVLYTLSPSGVFSFMVAVASFLAGQYVPIPMLPKSVANVLNFFPFRYVSDLPFRIYIGNINGIAALAQIGIQLVWLAVIILLSKLVMSKKINKLVVQGG